MTRRRFNALRRIRTTDPPRGVEDASGVVFETVGDAVDGEFARPTDALVAAVVIQRRSTPACPRGCVSWSQRSSPSPGSVPESRGKDGKVRRSLGFGRVRSLDGNRCKQVV
jgi:hypothetical protein